MTRRIVEAFRSPLAFVVAGLLITGAVMGTVCAFSTICGA